MTTRVTNNHLNNVLVSQVLRNREQVNRYSEEVSSGKKIRVPGETDRAGTVAQFQALVGRIEGYKTRITQATSTLSLQDDVVTQANELMLRAKEIAAQGANTTNSNVTRTQMAEEVFQLRDQLATLANTTYQGRYIFGGADDDDPPFDQTTYTEPASGLASVRYVHDGEVGTDVTRSVQISDDIEIRVNTPGNELFGGSLEALERLGRSLAGYQTLPASGTPDGTGSAYTFPAQFETQTQDIQNSIILIDQAREGTLLPERVNLGGRLKRLEYAESLLTLNKTNADRVLGQLQDADVVESATNLSLAQTAFEASLQVTLRALNLSITDFI